MIKKDEDANEMITYRCIEALVDGELNSDDEKKLVKKIEKNKALKHHYEALIDQKENLKKWWASYKKDH